jgi:glyoxylase-like metal-dependent hydrolase (beta-lactamase superfamily II)
MGTEIITESGEFLKYLYLIDTMQMRTPKMTAAFMYWDGEICLLMDIGTSIEVPSVLKTLKKWDIPLSKVTGIVLTHYHFDHGGGSLDLWRHISKFNPNFKIFTTGKIKFLLQNAADHLKGAKTTFGELVGSMNALSHDEAEMVFNIVKLDQKFAIKMKEGYSIQLTPTPGHSYDHVTPTVIKNGQTLFCFVGETAGIIYKGDAAFLSPSSMPPNFNYNCTVESVDRIKALKPHSIGFSHFGVLKGSQEVLDYLDRYDTFMSNFRKEIIDLYEINPSTRYIMENLSPIYLKSHPNVNLGIVTGVMIDLGYRKPKYEQISK